MTYDPTQVDNMIQYGYNYMKKTFYVQTYKLSLDVFKNFFKVNA